MDAETRRRARRLRRDMTPAEVVVWEGLRRRRLGIRFRRQDPIGPFIVDFVCHAAKLVVELDGQPHYNDYSDYDWRRTKFPQRRGYHVLRFDNHEILDDLDGALAQIRDAVRLGCVLPPPAGNQYRRPQAGVEIE